MARAAVPPHQSAGLPALHLKSDIHVQFDHLRRLALSSNVMEQAVHKLLAASGYESAKAAAYELLMKLLPILTEPQNKPLCSIIVSWMVAILQQDGPPTVEMLSHQQWLMLVVICASIRRLQQEFSCPLATLLQIQEAQGRFCQHLGRLAVLASNAGLLHQMQLPSGLSYKLTANGRAFKLGNNLLLGRFNRALKSSEAHEKISSELGRLQSNSGDITVGDLCAGDWLKKLLVVTIRDIKDLEGLLSVSVQGIQQTMKQLAPLASLLLLGPSALGADEQQQQQQLQALLEHIKQGPLQRFVIVKQMSVALPDTNTSAAVAGADGPAMIQPVEYLCNFQGLDDGVGLLQVASQLSAEDSGDSNDSLICLPGDSAHTSAEPLIEQQGQCSSRTSKQQVASTKLVCLNNLCLSSNLGSDMQLAASLEDLGIILELWQRDVHMALYGSQVSGAAAAAAPLNLMLLNVQGCRTGNPSHQGTLHQEQVSELLKLKSLEAYLCKHWPGTVKDTFEYDEFGSLGPAAEVSLKLGINSEPIRLRIVIGDVPGATSETAFIATMMQASPKLRFATQATQLLIKEAKGAYKLSGRDIDPHALVHMLLSHIKNQHQEQWWGVNGSSSLLPEQLTSQQLQQRLHKMNVPAVEREEAAELWTRLQSLWGSLSQNSQQLCIEQVGRSVTTVAAAAAAALSQVRKSSNALQTVPNRLPDNQRRAVAAYQQAVAAYRTYQRLEISEAAFNTLRLICSHAAVRCGLYLAQGGRQDLGSVLDVCQASCKDQLYSASVSADMLAYLVSQNAELQQQLNSKQGKGVLVWGTPAQDLADHYAVPVARNAVAAAARGDFEGARRQMHSAVVNLADVVRQAAVAGIPGLLGVLSSVQMISAECQRIFSSIDPKIERLREEVKAAKQASNYEQVQVKAVQRNFNRAKDERYLLQEVQRSMGLLLWRIHTTVYAPRRVHQPAAAAFAASADDAATLNEQLVKAWRLISEQQKLMQGRNRQS